LQDAGSHSLGDHCRMVGDIRAAEPRRYVPDRGWSRRLGRGRCIAAEGLGGDAGELVRLAVRLWRPTVDPCARLAVGSDGPDGTGGDAGVICVRLRPGHTVLAALLAALELPLWGRTSLPARARVARASFAKVAPLFMCRTMGVAMGS
jgi:hypothetical protein